MPNRNLFITTDTSLDSGTAGYTDPSLVADGAIAVLDAEDASGGSENMGGTDLPNKAIIVRGGDNPQIEFIEKDKIEKVITKAYRAETKQQTAVGYNGTSGALTADAGVASIKVVRIDKGYEPYPRFTAATKVSNGTNPYDIAADLAEQFRTSSAPTRKFVDADVISSEASTQAEDSGASAVTLSVTKNAKNVTASAEIDGLAEGGQIRIGHATDTTAPVYVAESIDGTSITLDRAYAGETATGVAAGVVDAGAPASDDEVGVLITGVDSEDGEPAISFSTSLDDTLVNDNITSIATPTTGNGTNAQIKNLESFSWGNRSYTMTNYFPQTPESNVASGVNYDLVTILYKNDNDDGVVASNKYREIHIAFPEGNVDLATVAAFFNS